MNGCFWHGHGLAPLEVKSEEIKVKSDDYATLQSSECCKIPKTNREFWVRKIRRNQEHDIEVKKKLASMGWHSTTILGMRTEAVCQGMIKSKVPSSG